MSLARIKIFAVPDGKCHDLTCVACHVMPCVCSIELSRSTLFGRSFLVKDRNETALQQPHISIEYGNEKQNLHAIIYGFIYTENLQNDDAVN